MEAYAVALKVNVTVEPETEVLCRVADEFFEIHAVATELLPVPAKTIKSVVNVVSEV